MDKSSRIEFQKIDCNCNDCKFMIRDIERFKKSLEDHHKWQLDYFNTIKSNLLAKAKKWRKRGYPEKAVVLEKEAAKMRFQFDKKEVSINYGHCSRFNKPVTFIPNTCQLHTQECFQHRRE